MPTIGFFNLPLFGHVNPTLPVAAYLVARGARVLYFIPEDFKGLEAIARTGAEIHLLPRFLSALGESETTAKLRLGSLASSYSALLEYANLVLPSIVTLLQEERVELAVNDSICPWGKFAAKVAGLPNVCTCAVIFGIASYRAKPSKEVFLRRMRFLASQITKLPDYIRIWRQIGTLRNQYSLESLKFTLQYFGDLNIVFTSKEFLPYSEHLDGSYRFVGASFSDDQVPLEFPFPTGNRERIFVSLGTVFSGDKAFYLLCKDAFKHLDVQVVMTTGGKSDLRSLAPWPENFFVTPFLPPPRVLPTASVFISHAGANSVNESLYYGVPLIMYPQMGEQRFTAECVVRKRAGVILRDQHLTPSGLRDVTLEVLRDKHYKECATAIGETLRRAGGSERAADLILQYHSKVTSRPAVSSSGLAD
jgi:MGT family glycosyltransferase